MPLGKTIKLFLTDGSSTGPIVAEVMNWTGRVVVIPRAQLYEIARREELQRTGVYIIVGPDAEKPMDRIYIGEGDEVFARLRSHDGDETKDFWTRAVAVTSKDFNLTKAHGLYLESRLIDLANQAGRAIVTNVKAPMPKNLPESDVADMEYFLEQILLILPVLGMEFLRPLATRDHSAAALVAPLLLMNEVGASAKAKEVDGTFVVLKGSTARRVGAASWDAYVSLRDDLIAQGKLIGKDNDFFEFATDVEFSSPSAAAAVVAAGNRNGRITWRLEDGRTYAEWKESQVEVAAG